MSAPVLMFKKQINKLHDKMKGIKGQREEDKSSAPLPPTYSSTSAYPALPIHPPAPAYPPPLVPRIPRSDSHSLLQLSREPAPPVVTNMAPPRAVAPFATRDSHPHHPAFNPPNNHPIVTDAMPAPLAFHPFKQQGRGQQPQQRKPLKELPPNMPRRGVPKMGSFQIPLDPSMSLESVAHYLPVPPKYDDGGAHVGRIPTPEIFKKAVKSPFVKRETDNMDEMFPDLPEVAAKKAAANIKAERGKKRLAKDWSGNFSINDFDAALSGEHENDDGLAPVSNLGTLQKLPGELRNKIYRLLAVTPTGEVNIVMKPGECSVSKCTHREASNIVPGLANTCRQLRHEILPIFCAENKTFHFDHRTVAERCTVGYLITLGPYIDLIQEYKFDMARPCWSGQAYLGEAIYTFTLVTPAASPNKQWTLLQDIKVWEELQAKVAAVQPPVTVDVICQCELAKMITGLIGQNSKYGHGSTKGCGLMALQIASAAGFADQVYRMKSTKQVMWALPSCKVCNKVRFGA